MSQHDEQSPNAGDLTSVSDTHTPSQAPSLPVGDNQSGIVDPPTGHSTSNVQSGTETVPANQPQEEGDAFFGLGGDRFPAGALTDPGDLFLHTNTTALSRADTAPGAQKSQIRLSDLGTSMDRFLPAADHANDDHYNGAQMQDARIGVPLVVQSGNARKRGVFKAAHFGYDYGEYKPIVGGGFDLDSVMSDADVAKKFKEIRIAQMIDGEPESVLRIHDTLMLLAASVNQTSVAGPGRAGYGIPNAQGVYPYSYAVVKSTLLNDERRFFRALANPTYELTFNIMNNCDFSNEIAVQNRNRLRMVAENRGLRRYPYLCFDTAEFVDFLSVAERNALFLSKKKIVQGGNAVDDVRTYRSKDTFSTTFNDADRVGV